MKAIILYSAWHYKILKILNKEQSNSYSILCFRNSSIQNLVYEHYISIFYWCWFSKLKILPPRWNKFYEKWTLTDSNVWMEIFSLSGNTVIIVRNLKNTDNKTRYYDKKWYYVIHLTIVYVISKITVNTTVI